jgi:antitoxin component YwqK of YwqJK toxin-antitoxin module
MKHLLTLALVGFAFSAQAQRLKRFVTYYDSTNTKKREVYSALVAGDTIPQGTYRRYYRNGKLEQQTSFNAGKRDSAYVEFHPTGARRLETTYRDGIRQGPFKTYYENGKVAQAGSFDNDEPSGELTYYHPSGEVKLRTTLTKGIPNGPLKSLYADGKTQAEITYLNGQPNGPVKFYYPSGTLQSEGTLLRGLLAGPYKTYYPTGQLETEVLADATGRGRYRSFYPSGKLQTEGTYAAAPLKQRTVKNPLGDDLTKRVAPPTGTANLDGPATSYYETGQLKTKITYRNGIPTGKGEEFYSSGQLAEATDYSNQGRDRKLTHYYPENGGVSYERQYKNDRPTGTWRSYFAKAAGGKLQVEETYLSGRLSGERTTYFEDGTVASRQPYVNGFIVGLGQEFYQSGKLKAETTFVHGQKTGPHRELREDGTLAVSGSYRTGKETGEWHYYQPDGQTMARTLLYRNGVVVEAGSKPKTRPVPKRK